jgi:hypothetical protein
MTAADRTPGSALTGQPARIVVSTRYTPESSSRDFIDGDGIRWTVREIIPEMRQSDRRTLLTRPGYENGWLSFRSDALSCRIAPYPPSWRTITDYELERWCMKARAAARVRKKNSSG